MSRLWIVLLGLNAIVAAVASVLLLVGPGLDLADRPATHLRPVTTFLAPCGDLYKSCFSEWKPTGGLRVTLDKDSNFPSENTLKVEKPRPGPAELTLKMSDCAGNIGLLSRYRREGAVEADMGVVSDGKWTSFGSLSWKPEEFQLWAQHFSRIKLASPERPARFVVRLTGVGTFWIQEARIWCDR